MARNKYPEETINRILDAALRLFMSKGYDHTSIQDILNDLGDLSKGAIYHHFKSKEDILLAVMDKIYTEHDIDWAHIVADQSLNGQEKLHAVFRASLLNQAQTEIFSTAPDMLKNPQLVALQIRSIYEEVVPLYLLPILEQGVKDGSISTAYPRELAEMLLILANIWINPMVSPGTPQGIQNRVQLFREICLSIGLDVFDDEMAANFAHLSKLYAAKNKA